MKLKMPLKALGLVLVACGLVVADPARTVGSPQCTKDRIADTLTTRFVTLLNGDDINLVYGCRLKSGTTDEYEVKNCTFTTEVDGSDTYLIVESVLDLSDPTDGASTNPCGFIRSDENGNRAFQWTLALRYKEEVVTHIDRDYRWKCVEEQATNTFLTASIGVTIDNLVETPTVNNPTFVLRVKKRDPSSNDGWATASTCQLGEDLLLELEMTIPSPYRNFFSIWGAYPYSIDVAPSEAILGTSAADGLLGSDGCPLANNLLDMTGDGDGRLAISNSARAVYWTPVFQCERYFNSEELWFSTYVGRCSGEFENDPKCDNFCTYNRNLNGRKRRQANGTADINRVTMVTITTGGDAEKQESDAVVIITVVTVGAFAAVVLIAITAFLILSMRKRRRNRGSDTKSFASSDRSLPVKY